MSLIQEALKRKLEEQNNVPSAIAPLTPSPSSSGPSRGGALGRILGFLLLITLLLGVAAALFYLSARKWNWKDAMAAARSDAEHARAKWERKMDHAQVARPEPPVASPSSASSLIAPQVPNVRERVGTMKGKVQAYNQENAVAVSGDFATTPTPVPAASVPTPAPVAAAAESPAVVPKPAHAPEVVVDQPRRKSSSWPRITVNGILASGRQGGGAAMINNRMVSANEYVEGARVVEVQSRGVLMDYKGEPRLLLIGQTAD